MLLHSLDASREHSYTASSPSVTGSEPNSSHKSPRPGSCIRPILRGDVFILVPCGSCDDCRERKRKAQRDTLLGLMGDAVIYRAPRPENWDYLRKLLTPAGHNALHCPREGAEPVVYTDHPFEGWEAVEDLGTALEADLLAIPRGSKLSTTRGWKLSVHTPSHTDKDKDDAYETQSGPSYNFRGTWKDIARACHKLKLRLERISDSEMGYQRWRVTGLEELKILDWVLWVDMTGCYEVPRRVKKPFDIFQAG